MLTVNAGDEELISPTDLRVERWDGTKWLLQHYVRRGEVLPGDTAGFELDAILIQPGGVLTEDVPLADLEAGIHRVGVEMSVSGDDLVGGPTPVEIYARLDVGEGAVEESAAAAWTEPAAYSYTLDASCGLWPVNGTFRIDVADGRVLKGAALDTTAEEYLATDWGPPPTIGELVALVDRAVLFEVDVVDVDRTAEGRPTRIFIDYDDGTIDDERCFEITDYAAAEPQPGGPTPSTASEGTESPLIVDTMAAYGEEDVEPGAEDVMQAEELSQIEGRRCRTIVEWEHDDFSAIEGVDTDAVAAEDLEAEVLQYLDEFEQGIRDVVARGYAMDPEELAELEAADAAPNRLVDRSAADLLIADALSTLEVQQDSEGPVQLTSSEEGVSAELMTINGYVILTELSYLDEC